MNDRSYLPDRQGVLWGEPPPAPRPGGIVGERFLFSPFSILDGRSGDWLESKEAWRLVGIESGESREDAPVYRESYGEDDVMGEAMNGRGGAVSIFDPVLCELLYRWFVPAGGQIVDPFAGGSVRGLVAARMGRRYWGVDLRPEQIEANQRQWEALQWRPMPEWVVGNACHDMYRSPSADFIFSCPPYGDLEQYSNDPADLSNMDWPRFCIAYRQAIRTALYQLRENRFACFVVGDFRDAKGFYRNFVSLTIDAFEDAGARLYNEAILTTPVGSACLRVTKQFNVSRKMAKVHQNVLVFCKGDPRVAATACEALNLTEEIKP
jgi:DNA modification methylase